MTSKVELFCNPVFLIYFFIFYFYKLLAACCQGYEHDERLDTVGKAGVVEVGEDVRETGGGGVG